MKRVLVLISCIAVFGVLSVGGPLVSLDIVPSEGFWVPYIGYGYDTGWSLVTFGVDIADALVLNGWYTLQVSRLFSITASGNTRWGGIVGGWAELCNGNFSRTAVGVGPIVTAQMQGMNVALKLMLFGSITGESAVFGLQPTISFWFDFLPNCLTSEPGCEAGW